MERRDFLKKSLLAGLTTGAVLSMGKFGKLYSAGNLANIENAENAGAYDLVAVKDMVERMENGIKIVPAQSRFSIKLNC